MVIDKLMLTFVRVGRDEDATYTMAGWRPLWITFLGELSVPGDRCVRRLSDEKVNCVAEELYWQISSFCRPPCEAKPAVADE